MVTGKLPGLLPCCQLMQKTTKSPQSEEAEVSILTLATAYAQILLIEYLLESCKGRAWKEIRHCIPLIYQSCRDLPAPQSIQRCTRAGKVEMEDQCF